MLLENIPSRNKPLTPAMLRRGDWPDDRVEELKRLVAERASTLAGIGRALGVSRGAVAMKIKRLGLVWAGPVNCTAAHARRAGKKRAALSAEVLEPVTRGDGTPVTIETVVDGECRFPHGYLHEGHLRLCGRKTMPGSPYCRGHHRDAYKPQKKNEP